MGSFGQFIGKMRNVGLNSVDEISEALDQRVFEDSKIKKKDILEALSALQKLSSKS